MTVYALFMWGVLLLVALMSAAAVVEVVRDRRVSR